MKFVWCLAGLQNTLWSYIFSTLPLSKESILPSMLLLLLYCITASATLVLHHGFCCTVLHHCLCYTGSAPRLLLHWVLGLQSSTLLPDLQASTLIFKHQHCYLSSKHHHCSRSSSVLTASRSSSVFSASRSSSVFSAFRSSSVTTASAVLYWPLSFSLNLYVLRSSNQPFSIPEKVTTSHWMCYPFSKLHLQGQVDPCHSWTGHSCAHYSICPSGVNPFSKIILARSGWPPFLLARSLLQGQADPQSF